MELTIGGLEVHFRGAEGDPSFTLNIPEIRLETKKITYLMGHNGSGKSVTLKLLTGEYEPAGKEIVAANEHGEPVSLRVGVVRQEANQSLSLSLTVRENLIIRTSVQSWLDKFAPRTRLRKYVESILSGHHELYSKMDQPCYKLSGGQRQTLAFLAVTSQRSNLLCLDEFMSSTDRDTTVLLRSLAKGYAEACDASVLVVSHDLDLAFEDADRIHFLRSGSLAKSADKGSPDWEKGKLAKFLGI